MTDSGNRNEGDTLTPFLETIYCGDCIAGMCRMPDDSIDLVFADPPFNIAYEYDVYDDKRNTGEYLDWSRDWIEQAVRVLKPTGSLWLAIGDDYAAELKLMLQEHGLICRNWVIWYYTFGVHCQHKFSRSHTHLLYFVRDSARFTFNAENIRVPSARQTVYRDRRAANGGRTPDDTWLLRPQDASAAFQADEDTWHFPRVNGTFHERTGWHGCQMPELLLGRIISACSNAGEVILDPFVGSGTTSSVAKKLDRRFIGFELSPTYAEKARLRVAAAASGDALEGARPTDDVTSKRHRDQSGQQRLF